MPPRKQPSKQGAVKKEPPSMTDQLQKLLTCGKCQHQYDLTARRPKMLVCHHSFCMQCIQSCIKTKNNQIAVCPTCKKSTSIGRNGVAALPNNEYLWPQLKLNAKTKVPIKKPPVDPNVFVSDDEEDEEEESEDEEDNTYGDFYDYDEASPVHQRTTEVRIFCETCMGVARGDCLQLHQICNYEAGIKALQERLAVSVQKAGENLTNEVQFLENEMKLMGRIQNSWSVLSQALDNRLIEQTVSLSASKSLLEGLPSATYGVDEAKAGEPSLLAHTVVNTEDVNNNSAAGLLQIKSATNIWNIVSNCNVSIHAFNPLTRQPENIYFSLQLNDRASNDSVCVMYTISKLLEEKFGPHEEKEKEKEKEKERREREAAAARAAEEPRGLTMGDSEWVQARRNRGGEGAIPKRFDPMAKLKIPKNVSAGCTYCFFDLYKGQDFLGRVVMEVNCKAAPKMAKNFLELCTGKLGISYLNSEVWRIPAADHIDGGDLSEKTSEGTTFLKKPFYGDASSLQDDVGMLRMRGMGTSEDGQPIVSSQFMIWVRARKFKSYARTLVFGRVVEGLDCLNAIPETRNRIIVIRKCGLM